MLLYNSNIVDLDALADNVYGEVGDRRLGHIVVSLSLVHTGDSPFPATVVQLTLYIVTPCPEKKRPEFFLHNFNKCRRSFEIFSMNHPEDSFY